MKKLLTLSFLVLLKLCSNAQGHVVINEYMPWVANNCGTTSEFVELYNFGPGPANIGCHILTDGDYSVTIPPNTILQPGQYYLISGQDYIGDDCANLDSAVHVNLNWNTCNCTSQPIPQTGDGFFTDGGDAREQVVLLDPNLDFVDAIVRALPAEPSSSITTSTVSGKCSSKTFDLDLMAINYETVGESLGRANSYARIIDGDCKWIKETSQSGNAPNFDPGDVASISYELTIVNPEECGTSKGAISINVIANNYTDYFPMNYNLAYDTDSNGVFSSIDQYITGADSTPSRIDINELKAGRYRITLSTTKGCSLKTFDFLIFDCPHVLPVHVLSFKHQKTLQNRHTFAWTISEIESVRTMSLEQSINFSQFTTAYEQTIEQNATGTHTFSATIPTSEAKYFRLRITLKTGATVFSSIISTHSSVTIPAARLWPNPARSFITIETGTLLPSTVSYKIYDLQNRLADQGELHIGSYLYQLTLPVHRLPKGLYQLFVYIGTNFKPYSFRFVKE